MNARMSYFCAAVDVQRLTGDERGLVAAQERGGRGEAPGVPPPPRRRPFGGGLAVLLRLDADAARGGVGHVGDDEAGSDRVDRDTERTERQRQRAREAL